MKSIKHHLLILSLLAALSATAATIGRHPGFIPLHGYGLDLRNPDELKPPVASLDFGQPETYAGDGSAQFNVYFSQHQLDLVKHFSLNASLSVKSKVGFSGRVGFGLVDNTRYSGNDLNFVFVCTRDYGTTTYTNASVGPQFTEEVNLFRHTNGLSGSALYGAISNRYGTHYIKGHRSVGRVVVIYTFHFDSTTTTRDLTASLDARYRAGLTTVDFHTDVRSFFSNTASRVSMTYQFYSTDPTNNIIFSTNAITSYPEFLAFSDAVVNYCNTQMTPAGGERSEFVVDRVENLRGYCALTGVCVPTPLPNTDYERWLEAYGTLARWDATISGWALDPRRMSWMNTNGQRMVLGMRRDVTNYRRFLEAAAKRHFDAGETLVVPDEIFDYFANFSRIPLPSINVVFGVDLGAADNNRKLYFGFVNAGPHDLTVAEPFRQFYSAYETNPPPPTTQADTLSYTEAEYYAKLAETIAAGPWTAPFVNQFTNSIEWARIRSDMTNCRLGLFVAGWESLNEADRAFEIRDANNQTVDRVNASVRSFRACAAPFGAALDAEVGLHPTTIPSSGIIDSKSVSEFSITNLSLSPAYGTLAALPIPAGMQALAASGSQGQPITTNGVLVVTNGTVLYEVGPLAYGSAATIRLDLVPLRTGVLTSAVPATVTVGEGLVDPNPANNSVFPAPLTVEPPRLLAARAPGALDLTWVSETGRLNLQSATALGPAPAWQFVTNAPTLAGGTRTLRLPATGPRKYFRLHMDPL